MRPPHLILLLICFVGLPVVLTFFSLLHSHPPRQITTESSAAAPQGGIRAFFSFHTPSTLFPPSAIISLTDDNSTFFLARPADFGSSLPSDGLSGQLWVGSGFGDDNLGKGGATTGAEGELGCSDVPGWGQKNKGHHGDTGDDHSGRRKTDSKVDGEGRAEEDGAMKQKRSSGLGPETPSGEGRKKTASLQDDGTDDHLHHPLPGSHVSKPSKPGQSAQHEPVPDGHLLGHADIQSLQESAEIAGRVVLLSRGGCGFLEKVKWVQRRGGTALIVGDNTRGGPLVTMYARGDTSNVTIPSLFTSHTTAHLLSSLIPPGGFTDDNAEEEGDVPKSNPKQSGKWATRKKTGTRNKASVDRPNFTAATRIPLPTPAPLAEDEIADRLLASRFVLGGRSHVSGLPANSRRPPSSGSLAWISEKGAAEKPTKEIAGGKEGTTGRLSGKGPKNLGTPQNYDDDFVIGVQDWRDPDLIVAKMPQGKGKGKSATLDTVPSNVPGNKIKNQEHTGRKILAGGSITPGSGEYGKPYEGLQGINDKARNTASSSQKSNWLGRWVWGSGKSHNTNHAAVANAMNVFPNTGDKKPASREAEEFQSDEDFEDYEDSEDHMGLWVTLTPTTISTSPFFDTLLVLVVSPLVTLTVVYALLLLRSRIRRRRWRAPKSVVDRLPVRTYHTMSCSSTTSSRTASPQSSSPTSPLLQASPRSSPRSTGSHSRPRSRTTSGIGDALSGSLDKATVKASVAKAEAVAGPTGSRKRYTGKQIECVVCLEEYIDGHSRVMSLPCGHEFHADCITPWLTTRRRTCPICKGDVVRSLTHPSTSSPPTPPYHDSTFPTNPDAIQTQAATSVNESPSSAIPIPHDTSTDLERGDDLAATLVNDQHGASSSSTEQGRSWRGLANLSLTAFSGEVGWRRGEADRNR